MCSKEVIFLNVGSIVGGMFSSFISAILNFVGFVFVSALFVVITFFVVFFVRFRFNPLHLDVVKLKEPYIKQKYFDLFRWLLVDFLERDLHRGEFSE